MRICTMPKILCFTDNYESLNHKWYEQNIFNDLYQRGSVAGWHS